MKVLFRHFYIIVTLVLLALGVQAKNADQTVSESSPAPVEVEAEVKVGGKPEPKVGSEEAAPDKVFRPSEEISEDLVIAFPVDI